MLMNEYNTTRDSLIFDVSCDDVMIQSINGSWMIAVRADLVDGSFEHLLIDSWTMTRAGVALCLAVASLVANRFLLLDVLHHPLTDNDMQVLDIGYSCIHSLTQIKISTKSSESTSE